MNDNKNKNISKWIIVMLATVMLLGIAMVLIALNNQKTTIDDYDSLADGYVTVNLNLPVETPDFNLTNEPVSDETPEEEINQEIPEPQETINSVETYTFSYTGDWKDQANVDLLSLREQYPEIIGWIFFENDSINYPIMYSGDDTKYLRTLYNGNPSIAGSVFLEGLNNTDFSDAHTVIYGHNMANGTMFGKLGKYLRQPNYYDYHKYFQIFCINEEGKVVKKRYEVFAVCKVSMYDSVYTICSDGDDTFANLVDTLQNGSLLKTGVSASVSDRVVSLSTCTRGEQRVLVSAVLVDEYICD